MHRFISSVYTDFRVSDARLVDCVLILTRRTSYHSDMVVTYNVIKTFNP
jgi:hypothetical protein